VVGVHDEKAVRRDLCVQHPQELAWERSVAARHDPGVRGQRRADLGESGLGDGAHDGGEGEVRYCCGKCFEANTAAWVRRSIPSLDSSAET
jgi:hypothetical protein